MFENEKNKAQDEHCSQSDEKEAENLLAPWTARKRSMLTKGNSANTSKITYCRICVNTKILCLFLSMMMMRMTKEIMKDKDEDGGEILQTSPIDANKPPSANKSSSICTR